MLAYLVEDATLTTLNPKASWEKVKTAPEIVVLVDKVLDEHISEEVAQILDARGLRPDGTARPGRSDARFTMQLPLSNPDCLPSDT